MTKQKKIHITSKDILLEKMRENYQSFLLGLVVFLVVISIIIIKSVRLLSLKLRPAKKITEKTTPKKIEKTVVTYKVKEGDTLWSIAEEYFGSGFNAFDIAKANNLKNPDLIEKNQTLIIPSVSPNKLTKGIIAETKTEKVSLTQEKYTVKEGDSLWKIALEAYGDGYQWVKIASFNNIPNPDFLSPGRILIIPR